MLTVLENRQAPEVRNVERDQWLQASWSGARATSGGIWTPTHRVTTPQGISGITVVWRCISLVAGQIATLPMYVEKRDGSTDEVPRWMEHLDPEQTLDDTISQMVVSLMTDGNAFAYITSRQFHGQPSAVKVLDPLSVVVDRDSSGFLRYRVNGHLVRREDMVHVKGMAFPGQDVGVGPITHGATLLGIVQRYDDYMALRFADGNQGAAVPDYFITLSEDISDEARQEAEMELHAHAGGLRRGPVMLPFGMGVNHIQYSARESELIASKKLALVELCTLMGVPPHMVHVQTENTRAYSNVRDEMRALSVFTIKDWTNRLAAGLSMKLLPRGSRLRFDRSRLIEELQVESSDEEGPDSADSANEVATLKSQIAKLQQEQDGSPLR